MFSREKDLMETGGGIKMALSMLGNEPFFIINGDLLTNLDFEKMH